MIQVGCVYASLSRQAEIASRLLCGMEIHEAIPMDVEKPHGYNAFVLYGEPGIVYSEADELIRTLRHIPTVNSIVLMCGNGSLQWPA